MDFAPHEAGCRPTAAGALNVERSISSAYTEGWDQATDLWGMDETRTAATQADIINQAYERQKAKSEAFNARLDKGQVKPPLVKRLRWRISRGDYKACSSEWYASARKKPSLARTLLRAAGSRFWQGGLFKVIGDLSQLFAPLVTRNLIEFAQEKARNRAADLPEPNIGRGIGDAIGLLVLTLMASVWQHAFFYRSMATAVMLRAGLTRIIFDKSLILTQEARLRFNNGKLMAHLSTDGGSRSSTESATDTNRCPCFCTLYLETSPAPPNVSVISGWYGRCLSSILFSTTMLLSQILFPNLRSTWYSDIPPLPI